MQYPPFSIPPIKGIVQKAVTHIEYSNTYLAQYKFATTFRLAAYTGFSLRFSAAVVGLVKLLPTLTAAPQQSPRHRHTFKRLVGLQYALLLNPAYLAPLHHTYLRTCLHTLLLVYSLG